MLMKITDGGGRAVSIALPWQTLTDRAMVSAMTAAMNKTCRTTPASSWN